MCSAGDPSDNPVETALREECLHSLSQCLSNNPAGVTYWKQMYTSYLPASADLLTHIGRNRNNN